MSLLTQLPAELRQKILLLVLPPTNRVEFPANFIHLSHINRLLRKDYHTALPVWTPTHYISHPFTLTSRFPPTRGYNLTRICLDLFSTAFLGRIAWRSSTTNPRNYTHPELVELWSGAVPFLSHTVREVYIDVTPAPAETRQLAAERDVFVSKDFAAHRFLRGHVKDVAALAQRIDEHYAGCVRISLTGCLSTRSSFFVRAVSRRAGRQLPFVGTWVSASDARCARLSDAIAQRTLCRLARLGQKCGTHPRSELAWLVYVDWSQRTGLVYSKIAKIGYGLAVIKNVHLMGELKDKEGGGEVVMSPMKRSLRAFLHQVAKDLGLETVERSEGSERHVVVRSRSSGCVMRPHFSQHLVDEHILVSP